MSERRAIKTLLRVWLKTGTVKSYRRGRGRNCAR
jgi:hypothetical protein